MRAYLVSIGYNQNIKHFPTEVGDKNIKSSRSGSDFTFEGLEDCTHYYLISRLQRTSFRQLINAFELI